MTPGMPGLREIGAEALVRSSENARRVERMAASPGTDRLTDESRARALDERDFRTGMSGASLDPDEMAARAP